jgi:tetratricopeptide (TPR) repeat protein
MARFGIGHLYAAQGVPEPADREWSDLVLDRYGTPIANRARVEVAELRYAEGERASLAGDSARAARWWERLRPDAHVLGTARAEHALLSLGQAYKQLEHWYQAAENFRQLAGPNCDLAYLALYELGDCELEAGRYEEALKAFAGYIKRFPDSPLVLHCEDRMSVAEHALERERESKSR